jgi:iron complex outermembrane receptor protein
MNVDQAKGSWWGIENRLVNTQWTGQRITLGVEYKSNWRQNQRNEDRGYGCVSASGVSSDPCLDDPRSSRQFTVMAQDEIQVGEATLLTVGASYDHVSQFGSFWSPRLGLTHDAGNIGLFKVLYGTAFRCPRFMSATTTPTLFTATRRWHRKRCVRWKWPGKSGSPPCRA